MQDNLKELVDQKRDQFETDFDIDLGWTELSRRIEKKALNQRTNWPYWITGVAATLLLVSGWFWLSLGSGNTTNEISEAEFYYQQMIDLKMVQVQKQVKDPLLLADIAALDQVFAELKKDLKDDLDNEEVILAMMENYQLKLKILEKILEEIDDEKDLDSSISL